MIERKKKILYAITKANWGGAQHYVYDLATSLPTNLYEVVVILGGNGELNERLNRAGIRTIVLKDLERDIKLFKDFSMIFKLKKIYQTENADIVHLNSSKMGLLGAIAGRLAGIPKIIFTGHGWAFNEDRPSWQRKIIYYLHRLTIGLAHKTIAVSDQTRKQIDPQNKFSHKIITIRNGIGKIDFLDKAEARQKIKEKAVKNLDNQIWLGTISELHKNKGLKYLIEAINLLKKEGVQPDQLPLTIIIGEGEQKKELQEIINKNNLSQNIILLGAITEASKYLKAFDIFALTSITEALPYVLLEAGQAGLPIIASAVGGIPEIIENNKSGILVDAKRAGAIKEAVKLLLDQPKKRLIIGQKIQEKIMAGFNKDVMIKETIALYKIT